MKAFTLIETLIAITILTLAVAGPSFIASRAIIAAETARDQLTALYLAQESVEYVRMMRDNQYLAAYRESESNISEEAWDELLSNQSLGKCVMSNEGGNNRFCTLDTTPGAIQPLDDCPGNTRDHCAPLYVDGLYAQRETGESAETPFTRTVQVTEVSPDEIKIVSTVSWTFRQVPYSVTVSDQLTAWK